MSKIKISLNDEILCPKCKSSRLVGAWENSTLDDCSTREMRRSFIGLDDTRAYKKGSDLHYKCPNCLQYSEGFKLKIIK